MKMVKLGEIVEFVYGKALKKADRETGCVPVVGSSGVIDTHERGFTSGPTIVVGRKGSIGSVTWIDGPAWPIDTAYYVNFSHAQVDPRWAYWLLKQLGMENMNKSAAVPGLNRDDVYRLSALLPPLDEQRRIAAILDKADAIRQKRRQAIAHLDALAQSIFHNMFIPEDREWVELRELCSVSSGGTPSRKEKSFWNGNIPWFSLKDLKNDFLTDSIDHVTEQSIQQTSLRILHKDTILVGVRGMILAHTIPISILKVEATINQDIKSLHSDASINAEFLHAALRENHNRLLSRVTTAAHGTKRLETDALLSARIPCASIAEQNDFSSKSNHVRLTRNRVELAAERAEQSFSSLQSQAFRGLL